MVVSTKCCQIAAIALLFHCCIVEFPTILIEQTVISRDPQLTTLQNIFLFCFALLIYNIWSDDAAPGISASPSEDNMRYFNVMILGPTQSPYEGSDDPKGLVLHLEMFILCLSLLEMGNVLFWGFWVSVLLFPIINFSLICRLVLGMILKGNCFYFLPWYFQFTAFFISSWT